MGESYVMMEKCIERYGKEDDDKERDVKQGVSEEREINIEREREEIESERERGSVGTERMKEGSLRYIILLRGIE